MTTVVGLVQQFQNVIRIFPMGDAMKAKISRRKLILAGGAAAVSPLLLLRNRRATAESIRMAASDYAVSVVLGSDPNFSYSLDRFFPGLANDPTFQQIAPLSLVVTHEQGPPVRAFSVSWTISNPTGTSETPLYFYVSLGSPATGHFTSALASARRNILESGQTRLVTPFFSWADRYYSRNAPPNWTAALSRSDPGAFLISESQKATQVAVALDGVLFSDWKLMGPDKHALGWKIRSRRNAEHDEGLVVYKLLKSGAPDSQIIQVLREHGAAQVSMDDHKHWYWQARRFHAKVLLKAFSDSDRETFTKALVRLKLQRKTLITRVDA